MIFLLLLSLAKEGGGGVDEMRVIDSNGVRIAHLLERGRITDCSSLLLGLVWVSLHFEMIWFWGTAHLPNVCVIFWSSISCLSLVIHSTQCSSTSLVMSCVSVCVSVSVSVCVTLWQCDRVSLCVSHPTYPKFLTKVPSLTVTLMGWFYKVSVSN